MAAGTSLCQSCHTRPQYLDPVTGKLHSYCSKGCAYTTASVPSLAGGNGNNCEHCQVFPKFSDGLQTHPYCSRSCAQAAKLSNPSKRGPTIGIPPVSSPGACSIPGCTNQVFKDSNGKASKYCNKSHKALGANGCLNCRQAQTAAGSHFCQPCQSIIQGKAPMIVEVPEDHHTFRSVAAQFEKSWRHKTACPTVRAVYKVISTQQNLDKYEVYKSSVESRGQFVKTNRSAGNENRRWHGTSRRCTLGDKGCTLFCTSTACSLCCIVRTSYDMNQFARKTGWGRFGSGIYTSSTSSKSNDYSTNLVASPWKAVLLNKVVVGKGYKMLRDSPSMTAPPAGYDSVLAEVGGSLTYDELVVYNDDALRPSYLVMYDKP